MHLKIHTNNGKATWCSRRRMWCCLNPEVGGTHEGGSSECWWHVPGRTCGTRGHMRGCSSQGRSGGREGQALAAQVCTVYHVSAPRKRRSSGGHLSLCLHPLARDQACAEGGWAAQPGCVSTIRYSHGRQSTALTECWPALSHSSLYLGTQQLGRQHLPRQPASLKLIYLGHRGNPRSPMNCARPPGIPVPLLSSLGPFHICILMRL